MERGLKYITAQMKEDRTDETPNPDFCSCNGIEPTGMFGGQLSSSPGLFVTGFSYSNLYGCLCRFGDNLGHRSSSGATELETRRFDHISSFYHYVDNGMLGTFSASTAIYSLVAAPGLPIDISGAGLIIAA